MIISTAQKRNLAMDILGLKREQMIYCTFALNVKSFGREIIGPHTSVTMMIFQQ